MDDDYETSGDYETAGEYETVGQAYPLARSLPQRRPAFQRRALPTMPMARQQQAAPRMPFMPQGGGMTESAVRSIVRQEVIRAVPYGDVPTRPRPDEAMFPMGLGTGTLTAAIPSIILSAQPQRAFRGERLVLSVQRSAGAAAVAPLLTEFTIGDYKQLVGGGALPVDVFSSDAFGVRLMLDASIPGVLYSITITATVPGGESVIVSGAVIGRAGEAAQR